MFKFLRKRVVIGLVSVGKHVVRFDIECEPTLSGAVGHPLLLKWIGRARPLKYNECRTFLLLFRFSDLTMDVRTVDIVHSYCRKLNIGSVTVLACYHGVNGNVVKRGDFRSPKRIKIRRTRRGRLDLERTNRRSESVLFAAIRLIFRKQ